MSGSPSLKHPQAQATGASDKPEEVEYGFVDLLIVLAKHKKLVLGFPLAVSLIAAAVTLALPNVYKASTRLLPPQQAQSGAAALLSQLGGMGGLAAGASGLKSPADVYIGMLKSRTIADKLIEQFDLKASYDTDSQEDARKLLGENTSIASGKDGLITVEVEDKDQKMVASLANAYVTELVKLTRVVAVTEASQRRMFYERQLELSKNNLSAAEMSLKQALGTRGVISVDADSRAIVETVGRLRAQVSAKEVQLSSMQAFVTQTNPEYRRAQEELNGLRAELSKLENGREDSTLTAGKGGSKNSGLENIKILRDVKYHQMLYELLAKQYEVARLDEAKDASVIQVLDPALVPERKFKPKRAIIVLLVGLFASLVAVATAFVLEARQRAMTLPHRAARWNELRSYLRAK